MDETDVHYPPAGTGLNHPAVLTFYHIIPPEGVSFEEFQKYVQDETARMGAKFRGLDKNGGIWEIEVPHFTRYGLGCGVKRSRGNDEIVETVRKVKPPMKSMSRDRAREMAAVSASVQKTPWVARSPLHALLETILGETEVPRGWELEGTPGWPAICAENALFCGSGENVAKPRPLEIVSFPAGIALLEVLRDHVTVVEEDETPLVALMDASSASHALRSFIEVAETERDSFHMLLFELIRALFAPISGDGNPDDFRLRLLSRFAQRALSLSRPNFPPSSEADAPFAAALAALFRHDVTAACEELRNAGYDRLAVQVAQISGNETPVLSRLFGGVSRHHATAGGKVGKRRDFGRSGAVETPTAVSDGGRFAALF